MTSPETHVWLEFPETGGKAPLPVEAAEAWQARGWVPCDPPEEPNTLRDPEPEPEPEPEPKPAKSAGKSAKQKTEED